MSQQLDDFDQRFVALCELHGKEPSPFFCDLYRRSMLEKLTMKDACKALEMAFSSKTFGFPKPGDVIALMLGDALDASLLAWETLDKAIRCQGHYKSILFTDSKITRVVEALGGWIRVCMWTLDEMPFRRTEFMKLYQAVKNGGEQRVLFGQVALQNSALGYLDRIPDPVVIGGPDSLKLIEEQPK